MMNPLTPQKRMSLRELISRIDRIAADLNVLLVVIAIGLATLDFTFLVTKKVVENLPVTHVTYDTIDPSAK